MQILIVDDDDFMLTVLRQALTNLGHDTVSAHNGQEALDLLRGGEIRMVITDWEMPGLNGLDLCRAVRHEQLSGYVYIIMLTGVEGAKSRREGLNAGADDFLNKPLDLEELHVCLNTAARILALETRDVALFALAKLAESRDPDVGGHLERVQNYSLLLAQHLSESVRQAHGINDEYLRLLYQTSALHDLGKVGIPDAVLLKAGKLAPEEFEIMKTHTIIGAQTLDAALQRFPNTRFLQMARDIAASHHEQFDGSGYPAGLVADQIPFCGRIVALADVYDAITSRRVYKQAMTHAQARDVIVRGRARHFDPDVVEGFLAAEQKIIDVQTRLRDEPAPGVEHTPRHAEPDVTVQHTLRKILVVEDDPIVRDKLVELLAQTRRPILCAGNVPDAVKLFDQQRPGLVIADWVMPGGSGLDLCRHVRQTTAQATHFIMLTVYSDHNSLIEAYRAGVDDFVGKPFNCEELLARVRAGLRNWQLNEELMGKSTGLQALNAQLTSMNRRLEALSITDDLTGLLNRRHAMSRLQEHWALAERYSRPLSVAMVDLDHFKQINDTYGHEAGDVILRRVAEILRDQTRGTDAVCRIGGEEFLLILPSQTGPDAAVCAERCRAAIASRAFSAGKAAISATISVGIASYSPQMTHFPELLRAADHALYTAKHNGRNQVCCAPSKECIPMNESNSTGPPGGPAISNSPPIDMAEVLSRCGGDPAFAAAVTERFRTQAVAEVERIATALAAADFDALRRTAHNLKSMAAYMAAKTAADLSRQLEEMARDNRLIGAPALVAGLRGEIERAVLWITNNAAPKAALCA
jgi:putative two-component system response regulator